MKKRWLALALILCLAVTSLAACGGEQASTDGTEYNIVWYNESTPGTDDDLVFDEVNKQLKEKLNVSLTYHPIRGSEYGEKLRMLISANEKFDLCFTSSSTNFSNYAADGAFYALDEVLKTKGQDILNLIPDDIFDATRVGGKIYAVPTLKDWAVEGVVNCNLDVVEELGLDISNIKSLEDLTPILEKVHEAHPTMLGFQMRGNAPLFRILNFETVSGTPIGAFRLGEYDTVLNQYETEEAKAYFDLMHEWYNKGYIRKDAASATNDNEYFATANWFAGYGESLPYLEESLNAGNPVPRQKYIHGLRPVTLSTGGVQGALQAVSRNSKNPEKTIEFLNLLYTDRTVKNLITQGIEGKHYTLVDGVKQLPEGASKAADTGYAPGNEFGVGNRWLSDISPGYGPDVWEKWDQFNKDAEVSGALGFLFDSSEFASEIAAMQNVYAEYMPSLLVGAVDPNEYLPLAMEKFRTAGMDKVLAEIQRQFDEWKAAN